MLYLRFFHHRAIVVKEVTNDVTKAAMMTLISNWKRPYESRLMPTFRFCAVIRIVGDKRHKNSTRYAMPEAGSSQVHV
jgi:hypothetical protein